MFTRVRLAGAAMLGLLAAATTSHAAPADSTAAHEGALPGRGAIGGQIGSPWILEGGDFSSGAQPRFSFTGNLRYVMHGGWRWQVSPRFGWNAYKTGTPAPFPDPNFPQDVDKDHTIVEWAGAAAEIQRAGTSGRSRWHVGIGPTLDYLIIENRRKVLADPASEERHHNRHLGATAEIGVERFLKDLPNTSIEATVVWQQMYARDATKFPSGWSDNPGWIELRVGASYYYDFNRGKPADKPGLTP